MSDATQLHVAVIGGGLAGLTAACYLGRAGADVTLFEQAAHLGGRATSDTASGFAFNRGIHALYCGGAAEQTLRDLAVPYRGHRPGRIHARDGDQLRLAPTGVASLLGNRLLDAGDKWELGRGLAALPRIAAPTLAGTSIQAWIAATFQRPRVRRLMTALSWTQVYSSALDLVSAEALILKFQLALRHPILYLDGGWQTLVDGLRHQAEAAGAALRPNAHVAGVEHAGGRVVGVRLRDGEVVPVDAVVIATSPQAAAKLVPGSQQLQRAVAALVPAEVACLDVALTHLPRPGSPIAQDLGQPCFLSAQSAFSRVAPDGRALIYTFRQLDPRQPNAPDADAADLEALLDAVQPGWRAALLSRRFLPRITAMGALPLAATGGYAGRPAPDVAGIAGVYIAGDWVGPGFLADASFASGRRAAELALAMERAERQSTVAVSDTLAA